MWERADVDAWLPRAVYAVQSLYKADAHAFFRENGYPAIHGENVSGTGAMSTNRAFSALLEYVSFWISERDEVPPLDRAQHAPRVVVDMVSNYYASEISLFRSHSRAVPNMFTDAHALLGLVGCLSTPTLALAGSNEHDRAIILRHLEALAVDLADRFVRFNGGRLDEREGSHVNSALVTLQTVRALDAAARVWPNLQSSDRDAPGSPGRRLLDELATFEDSRRSGDLLEAVQGAVRHSARETIVRQLGLESGQDPDFDPGTLVAALAILQRHGGRSGRRLIVRGIEVLEDAQDADGSWRADILSGGEAHLVYVSSIEMGVILANMLIADLRGGSNGLRDPIVRMLTKCFSLLEAGFVDSEHVPAGGQAERPARGWSNERVRRSGSVELWTTALALQLLLRLTSIYDLLEQGEILDRLSAEVTRHGRSRWPDLEGTLPRPQERNRTQEQVIEHCLDSVSDPSEGRATTKRLVDEIVRPILTRPSGRPDRKCSSFLLFGPPGARKTSLVTRLARALDWPLVTISPPSFLQDGVEGFERRASLVFADLQRLRRVVILFDECEELFRRRLRVRTWENRTHGVFFTSGMLPRLQRLHDGRWSIFAIATNIDVAELDPAIVRRGRVDLQIEVAHPTVTAQVAYVLSALANRKVDMPAGHVTRLRQALNEHESKYLSDRRAGAKQQRHDAEMSRRAGHMEEYWDKLAQANAVEENLPHISFVVLDGLVERIGGGLPSKAAIVKVLVELTGAGD